MLKTIAFTALTLTILGDQLDWKLEKEADNIKVYLAKTENSPLKQFKVEAFVAAKPKKIADAVLDIENNYKWFEGVEKAIRIKDLNSDEFIFSQVIKVPFPFEDRQVVQHVKLQTLNDGVIRIDLKSKSDALSEDDDYVRMKVAAGYWILTPTLEGTDLEYSFLADPAGNIPAWLANQFIVDNPLKTIKGLREYLEKS
jgi:hypothetical protein